MRTIWNGSISFGLVNIPVGMALATKPAARQSDVSFRMLHRECGTPIKNKRWCPQHDREVSNDEIVKGWEVAKGQFVFVEEADLEALETADDSRTIAITRFVELDQVDPIYFDRTYFLAPADAAAQRRPYVLLLEAMKETNTAAAGEEIAVPEPAEEKAPVIDLMEALKASVAEAQGKKPGKETKKTKTAPSGGSRRKVAARK